MFVALGCSLLPPLAPLANLLCPTQSSETSRLPEAPRWHCTPGLNWLGLCQAELPPSTSPAPPDKGASHPPVPAQLPGLGMSTVAPPPCPRAWPLVVHRPSPAPMGDHGHSTTWPPTTKDLLYLQFCLAFNFFLTLLTRRDTLHFQSDSPSSPLLPHHCANHAPSW